MANEISDTIEKLENVKQKIKNLIYEFNYNDFNTSQLNRLIVKLKNQQQEINSDRYRDLIRISLCGRFSCGKSAFLNSVIFNDQVQENPILPSGENPVTKRVTNIVYGDLIGKPYQFLKNGQKIDEKIYQEEVSQNGKSYYEIQLAFKWLEGCVLSDTPGFDPAAGTNEDRNESNMVNTKSHILLLLVDIQDGDIKDNFLTFIKQLVQDGTAVKKQLIVILTKSLKKPPSRRETLVNQVKQTIIHNGLDKYCDVERDIFAYDSIPPEKHRADYALMREQIISRLQTLIQTAKKEQLECQKKQEINSNEIDNCLKDLAKQVDEMKVNCKRQYLLQNLPEEDWWCIDEDRSFMFKKNYNKFKEIEELLGKVGSAGQEWLCVDREWHFFYDEFYIKLTPKFHSSISNEHPREMGQQISHDFNEELCRKYIVIWNDFVEEFNRLWEKYGKGDVKIDSENYSNKSNSEEYAEKIATDKVRKENNKYDEAIIKYKSEVRKLIRDYIEEQNKVFVKRDQLIDNYNKEYEEIEELLGNSHPNTFTAPRDGKTHKLLPTIAALLGMKLG